MTQESYTWQEIISQPQTWRATLDDFITNQGALKDFFDQGDLVSKSPSSSLGTATDFDQIVVVGCGSTHYLAQVAAATLTHCTNVPARAFPA
ncbi:MAG: hypothetical protein GY842_25735, partial [bacterium]|nr:hypothetical protein [bacterium]